MKFKFSFHIYQPKNNKIVATYDVPYIDHGGNKKTGGFDIDDDELDKLLNADNSNPDEVEFNLDKRETEKVTHKGRKTVDNIAIFPEDTLFDIRKKIFVISGIPIYRQHFYYQSAGIWKSGYKLFQGSYLVETNIRKLFTRGREPDDKTDTIEGVPIDMNLFYERDTLTVNTYENMTIASIEMTGRGMDFYVCDLNEIMTLENISGKDQYEKDIVYYGFIIKYFPIVTPDVFQEWMKGESNMIQLFPDIALNKADVRNIYEGQGKFLREIPKSRPENLNAGILKVLCSPKMDTANSFNIRNLFNIIKTSSNVPYVRARVVIDNREYLLEKFHETGTGADSSLSKWKLDKIGVIVVIKNDLLGGPAYLFIGENCPPLILARWHDEDKKQFSDIPKDIGEIVNPIFRGINKCKLFVGSKIPEVTAGNIQYESVDVSFIWNKTIFESDIRALNSHFQKFRDIDILGERSTQHGQVREDLEGTIKKGVFAYDPDKINRVLAVSTVGEPVTLTNQYEHLTDRFIQQKWEQIYGGKPFIARNQIAYLQLLFYNLSAIEYGNVFKIIGHILNTSSVNMRKSAEASSGTTGRMLAKFHNEDPELFNLKRHGLDTVYARYCQGKMQPRLLTKSEFRKLPADKKSSNNNTAVNRRHGIVKFWNFTKQEPNYYTCPHKEYPYMSFRVGIHPRGYCLPCCKKKPGTTGRGKEIQEQCLKNWRFSADDKTPGIGSHYIIQWNERVSRDILRLMHLPGQLVEALPDYKIETIRRENPDDDIYTIRIYEDEIRIPRQLIYVLDDPHGDWNYRILFVHRDEEYSVVRIEQNKLSLYFNSNGKHGVQREFSSADREFLQFIEVAKVNHEETEELKLSFITLTEFLNKNKKYKLNTVFLRDDELVYAVLLEIKGKIVHVPIFPSAYIVNEATDGVDVTFEPFERADANAPLAETLSLCRALLPDYSPIQICNAKNRVLDIECGSYIWHVGQPAAKLKKMPAKSMDWDSVVVDAQLAESAPAKKDPRITGYDEAIYYNYSYRLLLLEFLYKLNNETNPYIRKELTALIDNRKIDTLQKFRNLQKIKISSLDKSHISNKIVTAYFAGEKLEAAKILDDKFQFDRKTLTRLQSMDDEKRRKEVKKIASGIVAIGKFNGKMTNTFIPCSVMPSADHCKNRKIIMSKDDFEHFVKILADDIINPITIETALDNLWIENIVDKMRFNQHPDEEIVIRQIM